jgi:uncharacterized membrane protein YeaQ/YmgE (transglycosylase-associated protein family)
MDNSSWWIIGVLSWWIIVGPIAGLLARLILKPFMPDPILTLRGIAGAILVGILGAFLGSGVATLLFGAYLTGSFSLWSILMATIGSILLLGIYLLVKMATVRTYRGNADIGRPSQRDKSAANAETRRRPEEPQRLRQSEEPRKREKETKSLFGKNQGCLKGAKSASAMSARGGFRAVFGR